MTNQEFGTNVAALLASARIPATYDNALGLKEIHEVLSGLARNELIIIPKPAPAEPAP